MHLCRQITVKTENIKADRLCRMKDVGVDAEDVRPINGVFSIGFNTATMIVGSSAYVNFCFINRVRWLSNLPFVLKLQPHVLHKNPCFYKTR